jgi:hypothetical protein
MKKFLVLYHAPASAMDQTMNMTLNNKLKE